MKVVFILSVGHSGSTLLDIMLGQFRNNFSTGELSHITWQLFREIHNIGDNQSKCTCWNEFTECKVWSNIFQELSTQKKIDVNNLPSKFKIKYYEKLSFFEDNIGKRLKRKIYKENINLNVIPGMFFSFLLKHINENNRLLYKTIQKVTKCENIIDSSKDIIRFNEIKKYMDVFPIILIRNINDILKSKFVNDEHLVKTWRNYYNKQVLPIIIKMSSDDYKIVSYEKFTNNPLKTIENVTKKLNSNIKEFKNTVVMDDMHLAAGNPMRFNNKIILRSKEIDERLLLNDLNKNGLDEFFIKKIREQ
jgi:hypothetical protein